MITETRAKAAGTTTTSVTEFFSATEARFDQWRQLGAQARAWHAAAAKGRIDDTHFASLQSLFSSVAPAAANFSGIGDGAGRTT